MSKKKHEEEHAGNHERWLLTYADMITLLMIFFIILYSMSAVSSSKYEALSKTLGMALGGANPSVLALPGRGVMEGQVPEHESAGYAEATAALQQEVANNELSVTEDARGAVIKLNSDFFFSSGSADVNPKALSICLKISQILDTLPNNIQIEGHTDDVPMRGAKFGSNWELAAQRAINILNVFSEFKIKRERLSAVSYADTRPLVPNESQENRGKNRRVEIVVLK